MAQIWPLLIAQLLGNKDWYVGENLVQDFRLHRLNVQGSSLTEVNTFNGDALRYLC